MKIYNEDMTKELKEEDIDLNKGKLINKEIKVHIEAIEGIEEIGHYETIAEYPNGGKDVEWVIDVEGVNPVEEHDEMQEVKIYIPYTKDELKELGLYEYSPKEIEEENIKKEILNIEEEIEKYKRTLSSTDYKTLKYFEGYYTDEEYEPIKKERENLRIEIRKLLNKLECLKTTEKYKDTEDV